MKLTESVDKRQTQRGAWLQICMQWDLRRKRHQNLCRLANSKGTPRSGDTSGKMRGMAGKLVGKDERWGFLARRGLEVKYGTALYARYSYMSAFK